MRRRKPGQQFKEIELFKRPRSKEISVRKKEGKSKSMGKIKMVLELKVVICLRFQGKILSTIEF